MLPKEGKSKKKTSKNLKNGHIFMPEQDKILSIF